MEAKKKFDAADESKSELDIQETAKQKLEAEALTQKNEGAIKFNKKR